MNQGRGRRVSLLVLASALWSSAGASPLSLTADISNLGDGDPVLPTFTVKGVAYNAAAEGALTAGGLRAFYRYPSGRYPDTGVRAFPDVPLAGELPLGTNSEFAANATSSGWWLQDSAAFRTSWGIPGTASGQWLPPYLMRKCIGQISTSADDMWSTYQDYFTLRLEGRLNVPTAGTYTLTGSGDDRVLLTIDGRKTWDQWMSGSHNGSVYLSAGQHGFTADFQEVGGGQYYGFSIPGGSTLSAAPPDEHVFNGWTLEYGRYYQTQRPGMLTLSFRQNYDGSGSVLGTTNYWKGLSTESYGGNDVGPAPQADSYRMYMTGYWYVPQNGSYDFQGGADDRWGVAISDDPDANPWTIPLVANQAPASGVALTQGWRPFRMEFGEGGGGANWWIQWRVNSGAWDYFRPASFKSTADRAYDWTLAANSGTPIATDADVAQVSLSDVAEGTPVDLRLRAVGSDLSYTESIVHIVVTLGGAPIIRNEPPANTTLTTADFRGYLSSTGTAETVVHLYWGTNDGATVSSSWSNVVDLSTCSPGPLTTPIALVPNAVNYYRYYAVNTAGERWSTNLQYVVPGEVAIAVTDAQAQEMPPDPATFVVSRPGWSVDVPLQVSIGASGAAANGFDYSSIAPTVTFPVGVSNVTVTILPLADINGNEGAEAVILTVLPGANYVVGGANTASASIADLAMAPMDLQASLASPVAGEKVSNRFTIRGTAFNAAPETNFVFRPGGLQAFYRQTGGQSRIEWFPTARTVPDSPALGELQFGFNSEFATNPVSYANWWFVNNAAFRSTYGLPGDAGLNDSWFPPFLIRRIFSQTSTAGDDNGGPWCDGFVVRMEGKLVVPSDVVGYSFSGGGDDLVALYLHGQPVFYSRNEGGVYNNPISIPAGEHPFTADFVDFGGGQWYNFGIPPGTSFKANPSFMHTFAGWSLELGRWYPAEQRNGSLTMKFKNGQDGSGAWIGSTNCFTTVSAGVYWDDIGMSPQYDNYRTLIAGYWYVPTNGVYDFTGGADDRWTVVVSDNPSADPWTLPALAADNTPINGVSLTKGWRPLRLEHGEGGGGANFWIQWRVNGGTWSYFHPSSYRSTPERAYGWTTLTNGTAQVPATSDLASVVLSNVEGTEPVDLRLRVIGSDLSIKERLIQVNVTIPQGTLLLMR